MRMRDLLSSVKAEEEEQGTKEGADQEVGREQGDALVSGKEG